MARRQRLINQTQDPKEPVFHDPYGGRSRLVNRLVLVSGVLLSVWAILFVHSLFEPSNIKPAAPDLAVAEHRDEALHQHPESLLPGPSAGAGGVQQVAYYQNSGHFSDQIPADQIQNANCKPASQFAATALAGVGQVAQSTLFALLPADDLNGYLSFARNCRTIDVLVPELYEISAKTYAVTPLQIDSEMVEVLEPILQDPATRPVLMPSIGLAYDADVAVFLARLLQWDVRRAMVKQLVATAQARGAQGLCVDLDFGADADLSGLERLLVDMKVEFAKVGLGTCVTITEEGELWRNEKLVRASDLVIVKMFRTVWAGSKPGALAPDHRFGTVAKEIVAKVGQAKLVMALSNHAVDWISGQVLPETLSVAQAFKVMGEANAVLDFEAPALNSYSSFTDAKGNHHQIWMLDAVSAHNQILDVFDLGVTNIAVASLGLEDPSLWTVLETIDPTNQKAATVVGSINLQDFISYDGVGPFYRWRQAASPGLRAIEQDPATGKIIAQRLAQMPRTTVMERYGAPPDLRVALTFDDGPDDVATPAVLNALKDAGVPATFFVVGSAALKAPNLLRRMVDEGHLVGSHTFLHPHLERVQPWQINLELNATQKLIAGQTGRNTRLFRPPYIRGSGPMTAQEVSIFPALASDGYVVAGSDIVPPDWSGLSAEGIIDYTMKGLTQGHGSIILLHDGRSKGMNTVAALPLLIARLQSEGYEIVSLAELMGSSSEALMPFAAKTSAVFSFVSFGTISTVLQVLFVLFWVFILAGVARAIVYMTLAHRRMPQSPFHARVLPTATVIIPAYNEALVILKSVKTALDAEYPDLKVIVVDDGSTDATLAVLTKAFGRNPRVKILTQANQGKWKALNTAYAQVKTEIAVCIDADTQIAPDAIRHLVVPFANPKIGAVAGTILVGNKRNLLTRLQALEYFVTQNIARRAQEHINGIIVVPGALGAWRVEAVRDLGLLSNETLTEDTDLTMWMLRGGYHVAYAEAATGYTEAPRDVRSLLKQRLRWNVGILQSLWKHRSTFAETRSPRLLSVLDLAIFGFALPLLAPFVDLMVLFMLANVVMAHVSGAVPDFSGVTNTMILGYVILPLVDLLTTLAAFRFDRRERLPLLWVVPFQNILFRQLLYISVYRAVFASITGRLASWDKLKRFGLTETRAKVLR